MNWQVYATLLAYANERYAIENNGIPEKHAYKLATLFDTHEKAMQFIKKYEVNFKETKHLLHDACNFALPQGAIDISVWRK